MPAKDDSTNKTALYFEEYQKGLTITAIAKMFGTSRQTVNEYLKKHDKYKPRGRGNKLTKEQGRVIVPREKLGNTVRFTFYLSQELEDRLKAIGGYNNRKDRLVAAIKDYLSLKVGDRLKAKYSPKISDLQIHVALPENLVNKLDKNYKTEANKTRTDKIIAAIELFCEKYNV